MGNRNRSLAARLPSVSSKTFLWVLVAFAMFVYPLSLVPSPLQIGHKIYFNLTYMISFPAFIFLGLLAIPVMLYHKWKIPFLLKLSCIIFIVMLLLNFPDEMENVDSFFVFLGYVTIPLASAILYAHKKISYSSICTWAVFLWLIQIATGTISLILQNQPVGTPGNVNWLAAFLLMLSPFVVYSFYSKASALVKNRYYALFFAVCLCFTPTFTFLYHCQSRAAWLAIVFLPLFLAMISLKRPLHKVLYSSFLILLFAGSLLATYTFFPSQLLRIVEKDVRLPLWTGTVVMTMKNPMGIGSGMFQEKFTPFRRVSSYQNRLYAADMTEHPHNELLNVGAQLGLPAMLAFFIMLAQICRAVKSDPGEICIRIGAYFLIFTSMLDMTLVRPPTNFLGLFLIGLSWPITINKLPEAKLVQKWSPLKIAASSCACLIALFFCFADIFHDFQLRKGMIVEKIGDDMAHAGMKPESLEKYRTAIAIYEKSIIPFSSIISLYKIAFLQLKTGGDINTTEKTLAKVAQIDPNFSHLNFLYAQLHIQKKEIAIAEKFLLRECNFFPRNEKSWQALYAFSAGIARYNRLEEINNHLSDIYRERARQNFGEHGLARKITLLEKTVTKDELGLAIEQANGLLNRINHNLTDPLFTQFSEGRQWPQDVFTEGFTIFDMQTWQLRNSLYESLLQEFSSLPVPPNKLLPWFYTTISIDNNHPSIFPQFVWKNKSGNFYTTVLLFSMVCELNDFHVIIKLDSDNQPASLYLLAKRQKQFQDSSFYHIDLSSKSVTELTRENFNTRFAWIPGKTMVYYPFADYLLRNQILNVIAWPQSNKPPQIPPVSRLVELFTLTGYRPPQITALINYCYTDNIEKVYHSLHRQGATPVPPN